MARLAVTDQAAYEQAKAKKKHKKGWLTIIILNILTFL